MKAKTKRQTQPRIPGTRRLPVSSAVNARIESAITREMSRFSVSRSFVIAVAVTHALNVKLDDNEEY